MSFILRAGARPSLSSRIFIAILSSALIATVSPAQELRVYPLDEIRPGLRVEAHTVFQGSEIETFPLVVIEVLRRGKAMGDLILARAETDRLEHTGIAAGMSGSPVYAEDGRLLGAIAYGWSFSKDPICGITPIAEMMDLWSLGSTSMSEKSAPGFRSGSHSDLLPRIKTPLAVSGLEGEALSLLDDFVSDHGLVLTPGGMLPRQGEGSGSDNVGRRVRPGDAVAVDLLRGDASLSAIGTLTAVEGDKVLAFGHAFLMSGPSQLPMSRAEIATVVARSQSSFKIGVAGEPIGTIEQDRRAGVSGTLGKTPVMIPLTVRIRVPGTDWDEFRYEVAYHRQFAPIIATIAASGAVFSRGGLPAESAWRWSYRIRYEVENGQEKEISLADLATGVGGNPLLAIMAAPLASILNNPWETVRVLELSLSLDLSDRIEAAQIVRATSLKKTVRPGETTTIEIVLESYRGNRRSVRIDYAVPRGAHAGKVTLFVGGGNFLDRYEAERAPGRYRPHSLSDVEEILNSRSPATNLYVVGFTKHQELSVGGLNYPNLPPSASRILLPSARANTTSELGKVTRQSVSVESFEEAIVGGVELELVISPNPNSGVQGR